jgi:hypothetical protein
MLHGQKEREILLSQTKFSDSNLFNQNSTRIQGVEPSAYHFIAKMADEMQDERYFENSKKAKLKTAIIPLVTLFIIGFTKKER